MLKQKSSPKPGSLYYDKLDHSFLLVLKNTGRYGMVYWSKDKRVGNICFYKNTLAYEKLNED